MTDTASNVVQNDGRGTALPVPDLARASVSAEAPTVTMRSTTRGAWTQREVEQLLVFMVRGVVAVEAASKALDRIATRLEALTLAEGSEVLADAEPDGAGGAAGQAVEAEPADTPGGIVETAKDREDLLAAMDANGEIDDALTEEEAADIMRRLEAVENIDGV